MTPLKNVLSRLERVTDQFDGNWSALCPAHVDHNPSLRAFGNNDGFASFTGFSVHYFRTL